LIQLILDQIHSTFWIIFAYIIPDRVYNYGDNLSQSHV